LQAGEIVELLIMKNINILALTGGPVKKLDEFVAAAVKLKLDFTAARFADLNYRSADDFVLKINNTDIAEFDIIYFRVVGKRIEDATLVANYAKQKNIKLVDRLYSKELLYPSSISKARETMKLIEGHVPMPKTVYGSLRYLREIAPKVFGYPLVLKTTTGKKAREVWAPKDDADFDEMYSNLREFEKNGSRFFAQEFLHSSQRYRVFVLGGKAVACVTQPTKWRKRFLEKNKDGEFPEGERGFVDPIPKAVAAIAEQAAKAAELDISGVDVMEIDQTKELTIIEANAAPSWNLVKKHTGMKVEEEILKWLTKQI